MNYLMSIGYTQQTSSNKSEIDNENLGQFCQDTITIIKKRFPSTLRNHYNILECLIASFRIKLS